MKIDMTIKSNICIEVGYIYSTIKGILPEDVVKKIDLALSYYIQNYQFSNAFKHGFWDDREKKFKHWDGKTHLFRNNRFLSGLLWRVEAILKNSNITYNKVDIRTSVPYGPQIETRNIEIREYQKRIFDACMTHKSGIIQSATGSGKSVMITQLIANTNVRTIVYVTSLDLLYQMRDMFQKMLKSKVGMIGDGIAEISRINVCTVWTAAKALGGKYVPFDDEDKPTKEKFDGKNKNKIKNMIMEAECAIFDECHMLATSTLQLINQNSKNARYKFGFSGTAFREDNADMLLEAVCGPKIIEVTASELIKSGYLVKPKIHFINVPEVNKLSDTYQSIYKEYIVENEVRNNKIVSIAKKLHLSGRKVLILIKNLRQGEILLSKLQKDFVVYFVRGDIKSEERNEIKKNFVDGKIDIIIASIIYDQGIDICSLDALILAGAGKSSGRALQRIGRVIRTSKEKKDAIVIDFVDNAKYLLDHSKKRLNTYKREAEFEIKLPTVRKNAKKKDKEKSKPVHSPKQWGKMQW